MRLIKLDMTVHQASHLADFLHARLYDGEVNSEAEYVSLEMIFDDLMEQLRDEG